MSNEGVQVSGVGVNLVAPVDMWLDGFYATTGDLPPAAQYVDYMAWVGTPLSHVAYVSDGTTWMSLAGAQGPAGNAATISVGTTNTLSPGASATVVNSGTTSAAILDFGIPAGVQGTAGVNAFGAPVSRTLSLATAYQASTPAKPALVSVIIDLALSINIGSTANTVELIIGPTNGVAGGTGSLADSWRNDLSVTLIALTFTGRQKMTAALPANYYFAIRRTVGTGMTIAAAFDQTVG